MAKKVNPLMAAMPTKAVKKDVKKAKKPTKTSRNPMNIPMDMKPMKKGGKC